MTILEAINQRHSVRSYKNQHHPSNGQCRQLKDNTVLWKENNC